MEKLAAHLDVCQENLLDLIEKDSSKLEDQIQYWNETRREQTLLYAAKKLGATRLGFQPVPPLAVSESKAKAAIGMQLCLQSLQKSQFAKEEWTLPQTSREVFEAEPTNCFKKQGQQVYVWFEQDPEKSVPFVQWGQIYSQDDKGDWHVCAAKVDYEGLSYEDPNMGTIYYTLFAKEAEKFGACKPWVVQTNSGTLFPPNSSNGPTNTPEKEERSASSAPSTGETQELSFWGSPPGLSTPRCTSTRRQSGSTRRPPSCTLGLGRRHGQRQRGGRKATSPFGCAKRNTRGFGETPRRPGEGAGQTALSAAVYPVLIFLGPQNILKCWRYRLNKGHRNKYHNISSTFAMVGFGNRGNANCMLITFSSTTQMTEFCTEVPRPKNLSLVNGHLSSLLS